MKQVQFGVLISMMMVTKFIDAALPPAAKVIEVSGKVNELKYEREEKSYGLKLFDLLYFKDVVTTGSSSTARLLLLPEEYKEKMAFFLYENSRLKIDPGLMKPGQKGMAAYLSRGFLRAFIKGLKKEENVFIQTPNGVIGIRGTLLEVQVSGSQTSVLVEEGEAFWVKLDKKVLDLKPGTRYQFDQRGDIFETLRGSLLNIDNRLEKISISNLMPTINDSHAISYPSSDPSGRGGVMNQYAGINKDAQGDIAKVSSEVSRGSADEKADMALKPGYPTGP